MVPSFQERNNYIADLLELFSKYSVYKLQYYFKNSLLNYFMITIRIITIITITIIITAMG